MVDPSGTILCTLHRDVFERHGTSLILPGTVVVLKKVTIVKESSGKLSGIITQNNLVRLPREYFTFFVENLHHHS